MGIHYKFFNIKDKTSFLLGKNGPWTDYIDLVFNSRHDKNSLTYLFSEITRGPNIKGLVDFCVDAKEYLVLCGDDVITTPTRCDCVDNFPELDEWWKYETVGDLWDEKENKND